MRLMTLLVLIFFTSLSYAATPEKLFYLAPKATDFSFSETQLEDIKKHAAKIDILAPQIYALDENGNISGDIDPKLVDLASKKHIKLLPLVINQAFDQDKIHQFLQNASAQEKALASIVALCQQHGFYGIQFDIENINVKDKDKFSQFIQHAASVLHQQGIQVSVAIVPHVMDKNLTPYDHWYGDNWSDAYDYAALAKSSDFVTLMAYDQHTSLTTPGPVAALDWVMDCLRLMLKTVPAKKISLGIPAYSGHWLTGGLGANKLPEKYVFRSKESQISYADVKTLLQTHHATLLWQAQWRTAYSIFSNNNKNEYLFVENAKSFQAKLKLAKRYHLRGISVWQLGLEDARIWGV